MGAGGKRCPCTWVTWDVTLHLSGSEAEPACFRCQAVHAGDGGREKRLSEGSQWSPASVQSGSEGAGLSLWEPKGVEIKGASESITIHIWYIHMFGYLKGFNGNAFYISYAH